MSEETVYQALVDRVEQAIEAMTAQGHENIKSADIRNWVQSRYPADTERLMPSWAMYLSIAARDPNTRIARKPGTYAYTLKSPVNAGDEGAQEEASSAPEEGEGPASRRRQQREARLYPVLADWMSGQLYRSSVTANARGGGAWGNPDITGVRVVEGFLGQRNLEITTVEAKVSTVNWKREFFEAVSHKRFANRAYFAVAVGSDEPSVDELPFGPELRAYGEKFKVGVLVVFVPTSTYAVLTETNAPGEPLKSDEVLVQELWPAVYDPVEPRAAVDFLQDALGIYTDEQLYAFGSPRS